MICTLYSHQIGFEKIVELLKNNISNGKLSLKEQNDSNIIEIEIKNELLSSKSKIVITYRERKKPNYQLTQNKDCPLNENLKGLYGFISSLPTENEKIKDLLLQKIQTINCEFSIHQEEGETVALKNIILNLSKNLDAVLFVQPQTIIAKSNEQHFLDKNLNLIIDISGNCEIDNLKVTINSIYFDKEIDEVSEDQKSRKTNSENLLQKHSIKINKNLPFIENEEKTTIRTIKEIAERVTILAITNAVAFNNMTAKEAIENLKKHNLWGLTTANEKIFLENPTEEQKNRETWRCECIWTLIWALKIIDELEFPNKMADLSKITLEQYPIGKDKNPNDFINKQTQFINKATILNANDFYYRAYWACVDARMNNTEVAEVICGVVYERYYALNWLVNYNNEEWDDVSCDT